VTFGVIALVALVVWPPVSHAKPAARDGNLIAFESYRDGNAEIYVMQLDGSEPRNLTVNPARDGRPTWQPPEATCQDGFPPQRFAFESDSDGGDLDIFVSSPVDATSTEPVTRTNITPGSAENDAAPVWSPGGAGWLTQMIAFTKGPVGERDVYVMTTNGTGERNVTKHTGDDANPEWSPDGQYLAFESDRSGTRQIWIVHVRSRTSDGIEFPIEGAPAMRATEGGGPKFDPSWAHLFDEYHRPHLILYSTEVAGTRYIDLLEDVAPGSPFSPSETWQLTGDPGGDGGPSWSPHGADMLFDSSRSGNREIYMADPDGENALRLTDDPESDLNADWMPAPDCAGVSPRPPYPRAKCRGCRPPSPSNPPGDRNSPVDRRADPPVTTQKKCTIRGGPRSDLLRGTPRRDVICGNGGNDRIYAGRGDDRISGGSGNDRIAGGPGNDRISGGSGRDQIDGGRGNDRIFARDGKRDRIRGGRGRDRASTDRGLDRATSVGG
jgi:hypothetical protein